MCFEACVILKLLLENAKGKSRVPMEFGIYSSRCFLLSVAVTPTWDFHFFPLNFTFHSGTPRETMHLLLLGVGFVRCISPVCLASFLWRRFFCGRISHETCDTPHGFCVSVSSNDIRHVLGHDSSAALMGILSDDWSIHDEHIGSTVNCSWNDFPEMVK